MPAEMTASGLNWKSGNGLPDFSMAAAIITAPPAMISQETVAGR